MRLPTAPSLIRVPLAWSLAPEQAALLVRDDDRPFALIGRWAGGGALIGSEPVVVASAGADPFALIDEQPVPRNRDQAAVGGGWFGALPYELGRWLEPVGAQPPGGFGPVPCLLAFYDHLLRLDQEQRWWFEALVSDARAAAIDQRLRTLQARAQSPPAPRPFATEPWSATPGPGGHALAVSACRERIHAGDLFQANICARLQSRLSGSPLDLFVAAVRALGPDRAAFLSSPDGAIASLSPELFLERHGQLVRSAPIKGTRPRPADARLARAERSALLGSEKDRAENVMIVDLVRNDLGRVCRPGSIRVQALADARAHAGVWHLVSEVVGTVRDGVSDGGIVRAAFPPGSVTGAPKIAAMNVIAELESTARGIYTGAIGFASPVAGLELNVAIRTFEFVGERAWLGVGGGIVADSDPLEEAAECMTKAQPLLSAIGARLGAVGSARRVLPAAPRRLGPLPLGRPDPAAGVFETVLVADGHPALLERHLARLAGSVHSLYGGSLPARLPEELLAAASSVREGRMRVDVLPGTAELQTRIQISDIPSRRVPTALVARTVPGGIGSHKWADRRLLGALAADAGAEPLLFDLDGFLLEAGRANVFVILDDELLATPPADGRILPGVTRARVLELAVELGLEVRIEPIDLARVADAREIFLTGALGGVEPAQMEGRPASPGPVTARLARALKNATRPVPAPCRARPRGHVNSELAI